LLLAAGTTGGIFLGKQLYSKPILQPTPSPSVTSVQEGDPTANWKTYQGTKWGFELKYPPTWGFKEPTSSDKFLYLFSNGRSDGPGPNPFIYITQTIKPLDSSFAEFATQGSNEEIKKNFTYVKTSINGYSAFKTSGLPSGSGSLDYFLTPDGKSYVILGLSPYNGPGTEIEKVFDQILSTFKFLDSSPATSPATTYTVPSSWKRFTAQDRLKLCLPPKWEPDTYGHTLTFNRDPGYQPLITIIADIPYSSGPTREAYFKFWEKDYPDVRQLVSVTEININGQSALIISPASSGESKTSPEGPAIVWYASGKLWKAGVSSWNMTNSSQSAFLKDFYTMISCSF